jgi:excisionase family DNA binding protein
MTGRLITARELAELLGVSTGALLRWTRAGQVPAVKLPSGAVRYVPEHVDRWLAEQSTGDATREVSPVPDATRRPGVCFEASPVPLKTSSATTQEETHARRSTRKPSSGRRPATASAGPKTAAARNRPASRQRPPPENGSTTTLRRGCAPERLMRPSASTPSAISS